MTASEHSDELSGGQPLLSALLADGARPTALGDFQALGPGHIS